MKNHEHIRAIGRGLAVIEALNETPVTSLGELHRRTGLPKPSLVRLLDTLIDSGYAVRVSRSQGYALTEAVLRLASGVRERDRLVDVARPPMEAFTRAHQWQVSLATSELDAMRVRYTTRHITLYPPDRNAMNRRIGMLCSAMGRVYFAHSTPYQRDIILRARRSARDQLPIEQDPLGLAALVWRTRDCGYATTERPRSDRFRAFAVPILRTADPDSAMGAISLVYYGSVMTLDHAVATYLVPLQQLAGAVAAELASPADPCRPSRPGSVSPPETEQAFHAATDGEPLGYPGEDRGGLNPWIGGGGQ